LSIFNFIKPLKERIQMMNNQKETIDNEGPISTNINEKEAELSENLTENSSTNMESVGEIDIIEKLKIELQESSEKFLRLYSDFENYKKRMNKERIEMAKTASEDIITALLPVIDDFDRALKIVATEKSTNPAFTEGIQLISSKLKSILQNKGLLEIDNASGKDFDTDLHDAITIIAAPTEDLKGKVIEEVEKGYTLNGKVLRHSKVVVGNLE